MTRTMKIDELCAKAIEDIKKVAEKEHTRAYGFNEIISLRKASKILGAKYFQKHFGRMPIEDVMKIIRERKRR